MEKFLEELNEFENDYTNDINGMTEQMQQNNIAIEAYNELLLNIESEKKSDATLEILNKQDEIEEITKKMFEAVALKHKDLKIKSLVADPESSVYKVADEEQKEQYRKIVEYLNKLRSLREDIEILKDEESKAMEDAESKKELQLKIGEKERENSELQKRKKERERDFRSKFEEKVKAEIEKKEAELERTMTQGKRAEELRDKYLKTQKEYDKKSAIYKVANSEVETQRNKMHRLVDKYKKLKGEIVALTNILKNFQNKYMSNGEKVTQLDEDFEEAKRKAEEEKKRRQNSDPKPARDPKPASNPAQQTQQSNPAQQTQQSNPAQQTQQSNPAQQTQQNSTESTDNHVQTTNIEVKIEYIATEDKYIVTNTETGIRYELNRDKIENIEIDERYNSDLCKVLMICDDKFGTDKAKRFIEEIERMYASGKDKIPVYARDGMKLKIINNLKGLRNNKQFSKERKENIREEAKLAENLGIAETKKSRVDAIIETVGSWKSRLYQSVRNWTEKQNARLIKSGNDIPETPVVGGSSILETPAETAKRRIITNRNAFARDGENPDEIWRRVEAENRRKDVEDILGEEENLTYSDESIFRQMDEEDRKRARELEEYRRKIDEAYNRRIQQRDNRPAKVREAEARARRAKEMEDATKARKEESSFVPRVTVDEEAAIKAAEAKAQDGARTASKEAQI